MTTVTTQIDETDNKSNNNKNKKKKKGKQKETEEVTEPTGEEVPPETEGSTDFQETDEVKAAKPLDENQKRAKAISKKLTQIEKLKKKQAEGIKLTPDETKKVASEAELRKEVNILKSKK